MADHHENNEDDSTVPTPTDTRAGFPHSRAPRPPMPLRSQGVENAATDQTRLDPGSMFDIADPTVITSGSLTVTSGPFSPAVDRAHFRVSTRATPAPHVSPPRAHTVGAAASTPPHGLAADINRILDDRDRIAADTRTAWAGRRLFRTDRRKVRTVREEATRRAIAKLRHERHMENLEKVRAWLATLTLFALLALVIFMGWVSLNIALGVYTWGPTGTP